MSLMGALKRSNKNKIVDLQADDNGALYVTLASGQTITVNAGDIEIGAMEIKDALTDARAAVDADGNLKVAVGDLTPCTTNYEKLAVGASSVPFTTDLSAQGRVTMIITCETADVCMSVYGDASTNHPVLRVGDSITLSDVDPTTALPEFIRLGATSGEIRAHFLKRS